MNELLLIIYPIVTLAAGLTVGYSFGRLKGWSAGYDDGVAAIKRIYNLER